MSFDQPHRRKFITLIGGAAAWPLAARTQQPAMPMFFCAGSAQAVERDLGGFRDGFRRLGHVEG
jgi:putative ABC transport system substrate-binding protein